MPVKSTGIKEPPEIPRGDDNAEWIKDLGNDMLLFRYYTSPPGAVKGIFSTALLTFVQ